jgi:hypothetical protein
MLPKTVSLIREFGGIRVRDLSSTCPIGRLSRSCNGGYQLHSVSRIQVLVAQNSFRPHTIVLELLAVLLSTGQNAVNRIQRWDALVLVCVIPAYALSEYSTDTSHMVACI